MQKINLDSSYLIGSSGERNCFIHPDDHSKVIKTTSPKSLDNRQNRLEYIYYNYLYKKTKISLTSQNVMILWRPMLAEGGKSYNEVLAKL